MDTAETVPLPACQERNPREHHLFPTSSPYTDSDPAVSPKGPTSLRAAQCEALVQTLDPVVQDALNCKNGKLSSNLSFMAECHFRHVILALVGSAFVSHRDLQLLTTACPLVGVYVPLEMEFAHHNVEYARRFVSYADYATETTVNKQRVHSTTAGLFLCGFSTPKLVRFLGGPHLGATRDVDKILQTLQPSVDPEILQELHCVFVYGAPRHCQGSSTEDNFLAFLQYGNHASANPHPDKLRKVFVKDLRRGFAIAIDKRLLRFIPDLHVTPLGIVDIDHWTCCKKRSCLCVVHGLVRGGGWCLYSHIENHQHYSLVGRTVEACNFAAETPGQAAYQLSGIYWHYCGGGNPLRVVSRERESIPSAPCGCHFL
ncbi:hypothetical protein IV203_027816 [Nitzschia inconspicua]|uniref:Uncharacterized protein n=1 Tax=Nitzschia inconspicua TaxID=303405 RepID=A0A9K3LX44_9STRA|nr:hypothetical protein IV203_027816 [Nitzschia inconspicua]